MLITGYLGAGIGGQRYTSDGLAGDTNEETNAHFNNTTNVIDK